ncbi:hypothetical protein AHAS_Ahas04G0082400 [Arachis hypogaea]
MISSLWYFRNKFIFEGIITNPAAVVEPIKVRSSEIKRALNNLIIPKQVTNFTGCLVRWYPPPESIIKINVDGSYFSINNNAACGGVIRNHLGIFLKAFKCNIGNCSIMHAEL